MATITNLYDGVDVKLYRVEMDAAEVTLDVDHGLSVVAFPILYPSDQSMFDQRMAVSNNVANTTTIEKDAGAPATGNLMIIAPGANRIG